MFLIGVAFNASMLRGHMRSAAFGSSTWAAARTCASHSAALTIGVLMNTHGLMELIILNIGLERASITLIANRIRVMLAICMTLMANSICELVQHNPMQPAVPHSIT